MGEEMEFYVYGAVKYHTALLLMPPYPSAPVLYPSIS